jgi:hypothetical protein
MTDKTTEALTAAAELCAWIAERPHVAGSINGKAAQVAHSIAQLQAAPAAALWCGMCGEGTVPGLCRSKGPKCANHGAQPAPAPTTAEEAHQRETEEFFDSQRAQTAFEAWAERSGYSTDRDEDGYTAGYTQTAWVGWQAALKGTE